ncbi:division/cell wall cluster transcriptional repressor MraZ [Acetobacteraceae bacterium H6797]|nr:division/cell wall cluster transcriptional repressor MraZ [Acetobacteraceae bacterium H6797]
MTQFVGTHTNKLDKKGRVSVPSAFRGALTRLGDNQLILRPSHRWPCIEAWPREAFATMAEGINTFEEFSPEHEDMSFALFSDAHEAAPDGEGRIMVPQELIDFAGLSAEETLAFVGMGKTFQIWSKAAVDERKAQAKQNARGMTLPAQRPAGTPTPATPRKQADEA